MALDFALVRRPLDQLVSGYKSIRFSEIKTEDKTIRIGGSHQGVKTFFDVEIGVDGPRFLFGECTSSDGHRQTVNAKWVEVSGG